ncbi:MAG TPA: hypothetical protein G4O15_00700 [Dehalococcoidia bacterium]|nr:hypothetical protein [Dehalococcoidia bacterium]
MKKIHKILVTTIIIIALVVVAIIPSGVAFADQTCKTNKVSFYSLDEENYPLKNGFVISTHMNGPVYFEKKEFQLHGAKPDTQFILYREIPALKSFIGTSWLYSGTLTTDKHGNGHIITSLSPSDLIGLKILGITQLTLTNWIYDGLLEEGGVPAYKTDELTTYFDWKWTP